MLSNIRAKILDRAVQNMDERSLDTLRRAFEIAEDVHSGQKRDDGTPYIMHPFRVALSLIDEIGLYDPELICAALLHDAVEDQKRITLNNIKMEFGEKVGSIVDTLTKPDKFWKTRKKINEIYFNRLLKADEECKLIKLADKLDNVRDVINSPNQHKRQRTAEEAKNFYMKDLLITLSDNQQQKIFLKLYKHAIKVLMESKGQ